MPGHVDLRDDRDVAAAGIIYNVRIIVLAVVSAGSAAHFKSASHERQVRPGIDLNAPALIIGEMEMEAVDLVISQQIDIFGDVPDAEEVAAYIQHGTAPCIARAVSDRPGAQQPGAGLDG